MDNLHPSFYLTIRKYRNDSSVSDNQFIAAIIKTLNIDTDKILSCGHGEKYSDNNDCIVCVSIDQAINI